MLSITWSGDQLRGVQCGPKAVSQKSVEACKLAYISRNASISGVIIIGVGMITSRGVRRINE